MKDKERLKLDGARTVGPVTISTKRPRCRREPLDYSLQAESFSGGAERTPAMRLPGYDRATLGSELAVFVGLGLMALVVIGASFAGSVQFALKREAIVAAVSNGVRGAAAAPAEHLKTNVVLNGPRPCSPCTPAPDSRPNATLSCPAAQSM